MGSTGSSSISDRRTDAKLAALMQAGHAKLLPDQGRLDLGINRGPEPGQAVVQRQASELLVDVIRSAYTRLGFADAVGDETFFQLVLARFVEPTSKADSVRVIDELGLTPAHRNMFVNARRRCGRQDYRNAIAKACFSHSVATTGISLLLYDVTTLYYETDDEDAFRKVGYSKERRVDRQIVIGLLVDRTGFPLEIHSFEGNKAERHTRSLP